VAASFPAKLRLIPRIFALELFLRATQCMRGLMSALRINLILSVAAGLVAAFMQAGCAHAPSVWHYYDECPGAGENQSFVAMAECGRKKRLAECGADNSCSPEGNVFVEYIDSLAQSVKDKKMTEAEPMPQPNPCRSRTHAAAEPMRRYAEYKSGGASRCTQVGNATKCY
jgi:hypothetical protein